MNPVVHFEIPYENGERSATFYERAFGWKMQHLGPQMGDYILAITADPGHAGRDQAVPGVINGGLYRKNPDWPAQHPSVVIGVGDIRESMGKVAAAGGKVLGEPMAIPGVGDYVSFFDTEGNRLSMLQPVMPG